MNNPVGTKNFASFSEFMSELRSYRNRGTDWVNANTPIPFVEVVAARLWWCMAERPVRAGVTSAFLLPAITKLIQNLFGVVACARAGTPLGALSLARSALETAAVSRWLIEDPAEIHKRLWAFEEYPKAWAYIQRTRYDAGLKEGTVSSDQSCEYPPAAADVSQAVRDVWTERFGMNEKRRMAGFWTGTSRDNSIRSMVKRLEPRLLSDYEALNQAVHLTPQTRSFFRGNLMAVCQVDVAPLCLAASVGLSATRCLLDDFGGQDGPWLRKSLAFDISAGLVACIGSSPGH